MELRKYLKVYDDVLPNQTMGNMIRWFNTCEFISGSVGKGVLDKNIRNVQTKPLVNLGDSLTEVHWCNLLNNYFSTAITQYSIDTKIKDLGAEKVNTIEVLKYERGGHYDLHVDHFAAQPRTMSMILLCNNDYEGGEFSIFDGTKIEPEIGKLIIHPSFAGHGVTPITKGERYSCVCWGVGDTFV